MKNTAPPAGSFERYMNVVDYFLWNRFYIPSHMDLPDMDYYAHYDAGTSAADVADMAVENAQTF